MREKTIEVTAYRDDPWWDLWSARITNAHGRVLAIWRRLPVAPPYRLTYRAGLRVVLGDVEFLDHDQRVRARWSCEGLEVLGGDSYILNVSSYGFLTRGSKDTST